MKKLILPFALLLSFVTSCSKDEPQYPPLGVDNDKTSISSAIITPEEAVSIANNSYNVFFEPKSRSYQHKAASSDNVSVFTNKSSRSVSDTTLYVVNFPNEGGYVIVSAPIACEERVLAIVPEGSLNPYKEIENPGLRMFLNRAQTYAVTFGDTFIKPPFQPVTQEKVECDTTVQYWTKPKTGLEWGQDGIYGKYCDNGLCGCFATATAMTMAFYQYPGSMNINFSNKTAPSVSKTIFPDWIDINKHVNSYLLNLNPPSTESKDNIGLICRQIGEIASSEYKFYPNTTSTQINYVVSSLKKVFPNRKISNITQFHSSTHDFKIDEVRGGINEGIVMMIGYQYESGEIVEGHIWLVEGYKQILVRKRRYEKTAYDLGWILKETTETGEAYFYHNWGWHGSDNGYFSTLSTSLSPDSDLRFTDLLFLTIK